MGFRMASRFATVLKDEILAVNEAAVPTNTNKETKVGLLVFEILAVNEAAVPTNTNKETKFGLLVFTGR